MSSPSPLRREPLVDRRPDQRMPEAQDGVLDVDQTGRDRRVEHLRRRRPEQEPHRRDDLGEIAGVVERGDLQRRSGHRAEVGDARDERVLQTLGQRETVDVVPGGRRHRPRQFEQGERVALRDLEDERAGAGVQRVRSPVEDLRSGPASEGPEVDGRQGPVEHRPGPAVAVGGQHDDAVGRRPAGDEREGLPGGGVHPVHVVGQQQHRLVGGDLGEQVQGRHRHRVQVGAQVRDPTERGIERGAPVARQSGRAAEDRPQDLVQSGVGQAELRGRPGRAQDPESRTGLGARPVEQRRLAHPGRTRDHQRAATGGHPRDHPGDHGLFRARPISGAWSATSFPPAFSVTALNGKERP